MKRFTLLVLAGLLALPALAQQPAPASDPETSYRAAYQFIARERWEEALSAMRAFVQAYPQNRHVDEAAFWSCFSMERLPGRRAESTTCYTDFSRRYPQSVWRDDAEARRIQATAQSVSGAQGGRLAPPAQIYYNGNVDRALADQERALAEQERAMSLLEGQLNTVAYGQAGRLISTRAESTVEVLAIQALARRGNDGAVDDLRRLALEHESVAVREAAIGGLARIATPRSQEALTQLIGGLLERAAQRDTTAGIVAVGALQQAARSGNNLLLPFVERSYKDARLSRNLRWTLLHTLRVSGTPEAQALLWRVAQDGAVEPRQRTEALQWLAPYFTAQDVTRVGGMLRQEPDATVREALVGALSHVAGGMPTSWSTIYSSGIAYYAGSDGIVHVSEPGLTEAVVAGEAPEPPRPTTLTEAREEVSTRRAKREQLAEQALQVLAEQLRSEQEPRVQRALIRALSAPGYDVGTDALARLAANEGADETTRDDALEGLGRIGTEAAYDALRSTLGRLESPRLIVVGVRALVSRPAFRVREEGIPDLVRLTGHTDLSVRRASVDALGRLDAPQARQALLQLIRNSGR